MVPEELTLKEKVVNFVAKNPDAVKIGVSLFSALVVGTVFYAVAKSNSDFQVETVLVDAQ